MQAEYQAGDEGKGEKTNLPSKSSASLTSRMSNKGSTVLGKTPQSLVNGGVLQIVQEFVDQGIGGSKDREQRPAFDALWKGAVR